MNSCLNSDDLLESTLRFLPTWLRLNRNLSHKIQPQLDFKVPDNQMYALLCLKIHGTQSMTQLADYLYVQRQQMTQITEGLVKKGLADRKTDPDNRRLVLLELSDKGTAFLEHIGEIHREALSQFLDLLDEENKEKFTTATNLLHEVLASISQ